MQAWLLKYLGPIFFDKLFKAFSAWISELIRRQKEAKQNANALKTYKEVIADPTKTREERQRAEENFLNS